MKPRALLALLLVGALLAAACSRKPAQTAPPPPEVEVTTVQPRDVPRVLERVSTLDGFINANINAQVQGYIVSRDYHEGSDVKKGDILFQIDPRPFEAALAQAKGTLAKDRANQVKADADKKRAIDLFKKKVISDQERDTAIAAADSTSASRTGRRSKAERLMTLSTSAVAVCCWSDSRSSLSRRAFSMAITACAAKLVTRSICLSVNGLTSLR